MLILTRKIGESILIGENVTVKVRKIEGNRVHLGIEAPREVRVRRNEVPPDNKGGDDGSNSSGE